MASGRFLGVIPVGAALGGVSPQLDLRILGRTLLHAAVVGLSAGLIGAAFFAGLEYTQSFLLERLAGYAPLRAHGEKIFGENSHLVLDPGAFALVGMGTFYGGLAHVPISSLIMVSEMAGSYDLLVSEEVLHPLTVAADLMQPAATVTPSDDLRKVAELFFTSEQRQLAVLGPDGRIVGFIDESSVTRAHLGLLTRLESRDRGSGE